MCIRDRLVTLPAGVDARAGASAMLQGMTAHYLTTSTHPLKAGETALVHAAAGGVGLLLISHDLAIVRHVADTVSVMYLGRMMETGSTLPVWTVPAHPYSEALIAAVPRPDGRGFLPESLPGEVPDPAHPPSGCRFHPRCPYAFDRCPVEEPGLIPLAEGRSVACWLHEAGAIAATPEARANFAQRAGVE